jgi:hypothetical protein
MIYLGIDPGTSGGLAAIYGANVIAWKFSDTTLRDQWEGISDVTNTTSRVRATIEHVHSMPKQGVASTFKFGKSYGNLEAFLTAAEIPFERVTPSVWQREFGLLAKKGETKTAKKNRHKALAQELFPSVNVTHAVADALLIAEWGRRHHDH